MVAATTRANVKVGRVACPWLIRTLVAPDAEFLFVPIDQIDRVARQTPEPFPLTRSSWPILDQVRAKIYAAQTHYGLSKKWDGIAA
jgi:hypothetical protein